MRRRRNIYLVVRAKERLEGTTLGEGFLRGHPHRGVPKPVPARAIS
jgi:hypothetical protein